MDGFTRGLYIENDTMWIGVSNSKMHNNNESDKLCCSVYKLDMLTDLIDFVDLPSNEIYGIYSYE